MRNTKKIFNIIIIIFLTELLSGCIMVEIKKAGVFEKPVIYNNKNIAYIDIPTGIINEKKLRYLTKEEKNGSKIRFSYLGNCGGSFGAIGIIVPIPFPWYFKNTCKQDGFRVSHQFITEPLGVTLQLYYNNKIYNPYIDEGSIKFAINDFKTFKKAKDKTLIIHKKKPDGTIFTKELPFEWKIVTEVTGGL